MNSTPHIKYTFHFKVLPYINFNLEQQTCDVFDLI